MPKPVSACAASVPVDGWSLGKRCVTGYAAAMSSWKPAIVAHLDRVRELRVLRDGDVSLSARVRAVKQFQHDRFGRDYAHLLENPRYSSAAQFFLEDLYGPEDFANRDAQFSRVIPALARLLPDEMMHTVAELAELHALSEELDQRMAHALQSDSIDDGSYRAAWRTVGCQAQRERQLILLLAIGESLDRHAHTAWMSATLRLMRAPARAAGLAQLQTFLETGLAAFTAMGGAKEFLATIATRERELMIELFGAPK